MGKEKKKAFLYDKKGKFVKEYKSLASASRELTGKKQPLFRDKDYLVVDAGIIANKRIGSVNVKRILIKQNDKLVIRNTDLKDGIVEVYNLDNEKIAEFISIRIASIFTGDKSNSIWSSINNREGDSCPRENKINNLRYYYKLK